MHLVAAVKATPFNAESLPAAPFMQRGWALDGAGGCHHVNLSLQTPICPPS